MKPLFGTGKEFTAHVQDDGVKIHFEEGDSILIRWCHWLGAIDLLCKKNVEDKPCVKVEGGDVGGKDTIEGSAKFVCVSPASAPILIATMLVELNLASVCQDQESIELTSDGKRVFFSLMANRENFSSNLAKVLKEIENQ